MSSYKPRQRPGATIGVVGAGYVGLVTAAALTLLGHRVVCADINKASCRRVIEVNELQKRRVVTTLRGELGDLRGRRIALLGLAFKPGTDDMREATSVVLAERLVAEGARLVVHDPVVAPTALGLLPPGVAWARNVAEAITGADAAVIVTEWPEYRTLLAPGTSGLMTRPLLIDGRNLLTRAEAEDAGYEWLGVGKPALEPGKPREPALGRAG